MAKRHTTEALRIAMAVRRKKYADGGKTTYLFQDPVGYLARKGEQVVDSAKNLPQTWENYKSHPVVTAFREEPAEMFSSAGKMFGNWVAEKPFAATRKAVDLATDLSMYPPVMVAKGILSSDPANAGEDEFARQVQYGIRPAPESEAPQYDSGGRTGYGGGGEVLAKALAALRNGNKIFPKPQRMFPEGARPPGGEYINAATGEAITGQKPARAVLGVTPEGKPVFMTDTEQVDVTGSPGKGSTKTMTNLYRKRAGWEWREAPEGYENIPMIVSTENRNKHYYSLGADYPKGVDLARYPNEASEPRLKPTTYGNVYPGEQVGTILNKKTGDEHPVYDMVTIRNLLAGTGVGAAGAATMPETEPLEYADGGRTGYADGGAPWANVYGNQNDPIFDQLQKDIAAQKNQPLPAIGSLQKNPVVSPVDVKPNVEGDAPVVGDKDAGSPYIPGGVEGGSSMDGGPGNVSGTTSGNTFGGNTYGETYGPSNTGFGLLDNAVNNPGTTAINAGFGLVGGPLGIANSVSGLFGGPTIGGLATGSYGNPTSMSGTSYSKGSDPSAPTSASKGQTSAPAAPAEAPLSTTSVATTSVAPTPGQFGDMYTGLPAPMAPTEQVAPTEDVSVSPTGVSIANTPAGFALAQQQTDQHALDAYDAAKADENAAKAGAQTLSSPNPAGELGWTGWTGPAKSYSSDIQSPQFSTPAFATAQQLADVPESMIGPTDVGQSISNYSYGTLADQNQQVSDLGDAISSGLGDSALGSGLGDGTIGGETGSFGAGISGGFGDGTIGGEGFGEGSFGGGYGSDGAFGGSTGDTSSDSSDSNSDSGGTGSSDSSSDGGGDGGSGDGGGGDGGGGEKRGGFVRSKRHASDDMVKQALKVTDAHRRKSKSRTQKDGSVVKQAVVLASKLAKRQRGRP